ncbi:MAG: hypothetical protein KDD63_15980, partial [Bacteroidetes bacterium]|nr:hypothetical protein [Bacteroidota bacterium]
NHFSLALQICLLIFAMSCSSENSQQKETDSSPQMEEQVAASKQPAPLPAFYIDNLKQIYDNAPNPLRATFKGAFIGDYYHLMFEGENGQEYDFGDAKNELSGFKLEKDYNSDEEVNDLDENGNEGNPEFLGKTFLIHWEWKSNVFLCCEGEYEEKEGVIPTIVKLELTE